MPMSSGRGIDPGATGRHPASMPPTDRLFSLIQILRDGRVHTARDLAERLEVSVRTVWRDMGVLVAQGLPVEGERGVGYALRERIDLPPMTLTPDEVEALRLGTELVARGADPSLADAAGRLAGKIAAVVPARVWDAGSAAPWVFPRAETAAAARHLPALRRAIRERRRVALAYRDEGGAASDRVVRPLLLEFWGQVWTLAAYCEARAAFRSFRLDRIEGLAVQDPFPREAGRELADYRAGLPVTR